MSEVEVVIAGGGAVGLALAVELGWRGRTVAVMEQGDGTIEHPRTGRISERTMEHCRRWGIAGKVRQNAFPKEYQLDVVFCTSMGGYELARVRGGCMAETQPPPQGPEAKVRCPQFWFDPVLADAARAYPTVEVLTSTRVGGFRADGERGVVVEAYDTRTDHKLEVRADYLVGCDGATSTVREALEVPMSGNALLDYSVNVLFRSPDLLDQVGTRQAERYIFVGPGGTTGNVTVVDGRELWRLTVIGKEEKLDLATFDPGYQVRQAAGVDGLDFEVLSVSPWRRTELVADRYGEGRVFLCGDAVHTMSPTGGFGANTGIGDAVDLGWKLDAVLSGWGGDGLLESYEAERRPVAIRNAKAATSNFRGWSSNLDLSGLLDEGADARRVREAVGAQLAAATMAEWEPLGVILGYRYDGSPICIPDGTPAGDDGYSSYVPTARPGSRAPHAWIDQDVSMLDLYGRGFVLLCPGDVEEPIAPATASVHGVSLTNVTVPAGIVGLYGRRYTLVRPDGHVAWRGDDLPGDLGAVLAVAAGHRGASHDLGSTAPRQVSGEEVGRREDVRS